MWTETEKIDQDLSDEIHEKGCACAHIWALPLWSNNIFEVKKNYEKKNIKSICAKHTSFAYNKTDELTEMEMEREAEKEIHKWVENWILKFGMLESPSSLFL